MAGICSTHVAMNFQSALAWEDFVNTSCDTYCVLTGVGWVWWIHSVIDFESSLELDTFFQHMLWCSLCPRWLGRGLFNTCWDRFYVFAGMGCFSTTLFELHFVTWMACVGFGEDMLRCIFVLNTRYDKFYVQAGIWGFGQHMLSCILCLRWLGRGLVNTCWDAFFFFLLAWVVFWHYLICLFMTSIAWVGFGHDLLRCIFVLNTS